jgi:hypothetical protein
MSEKRKVVYKKDFEDDFEQVHSFINENSAQNARKFAQDVKIKIEWIIHSTPHQELLKVKSILNRIGIALKR